MRRFVLAGALAMTWMSTSFGGEIDFIEDFALAPDRAAVLKQLVPGTEDYSYYHALHFLQTEQFEKLDPLITAWVQRHGETQRVVEVRTRYAIANYDKNPRKTLDYLRTRLGITYPHQKEELDAEPDLPTTLDPKLVSRESYLERAKETAPDNLNAFEDSALDWLVSTELNPNLRRALLTRITRPDYERFAQLILDDLNSERSGGFGSLPIHRQLLIPQLEELIKAKPELLNQQNFVITFLTKLQPTADEDWRHTPKQLEAYLDRLLKFANRLSPAHNSLKAHILYHRLVLDRMRGTLSKERFVEYLKLPRQVSYLSKKMLASDDLKRFPSDLNANYGGATLLAPIANDEPIVRSYLAHFLTDAPNTKEFEPYVNDVYLKLLFAEVKIVNGLGNAEQWAALLPPADFQRLKERVDLDFAFTNKTQFEPDEHVKLDLFIKNAGTLIVKVYEINAQSYYREQRREVDTDMNLDGLVANVEQTHAIQEGPLRRVAKSFEFPQLDKPGVYIIDFIGNGRSSRALVRKGRLRHLVRTSPAGQQFSILNEKNELVKDAVLWMSGHEYTASADGTIVVPFTNQAQREPIVISRGDQASLDFFQHEAETYTLSAGFYVDRESLLTRKTAQLLVRAGVTSGGTPVSLSLLDDVKLKIVSTDLDGIASSQELPDFKLFEDRESVHEFQVPQRLASLSFELTAKAKKLSGGGQKIDLAASSMVTLNGIDRTEKIEDLHLVLTPDGYVLELRGKTGEPRPSRPVALEFKHRDFRESLSFTLKTDAAGRIDLGPLTDIASITAHGIAANEAGNPGDVPEIWPLRPDTHTYAQTVHGKVGEVITLPFLGRKGLSASRDEAITIRNELSLLEVRNDVFVSDRTDLATVKNGLIVLAQLPASDFDLWLKASNQHIRIRVTDGPMLDHFVLGRSRQLETPLLKPLQIESIKAANEVLTVKLQNATKFSRVHVFATRYNPAYDAAAALGRVRGAEPYLFQQVPPESVYLTGRNIGDEYRYIIDRKYATKFPGNTLDRPSLLLNPWSVRATDTGEQQAAGGDQYGATPQAAPSAAERSVASDFALAMSGQQMFANLDFLENTSAVLVNLMPNEDGIIQIPFAALGQHQEIRVVAVDPINTTARTVALPERKVDLVDLRLIAGLDPAEHFSQQKKISVVPAGQSLTFNDITTSKFEVYDSLARVYGLYATLSKDPKLAEFSFILNWPKLKDEEKRSLYSKHASHELSLFLARKDPAFFQSVIKPYLVNKKDKTFVDRYLLDDDLSEFLSPWRYGQLNIAERILLARQLQNERSHTARHVADLYAKLPPDIDTFIRLFDTAVKRSSLETDDEFGAESSREQLMELRISGRAAPGGMGGGGMGGGMMNGGPSGLKSHSVRDRAMEKDDKKQQQDAAKAVPSKPSMRRSKMAAEAETIAGNGIVGAILPPASNEFFGQSPVPESVRALYRKLDKTMEWAENNYHHLTIDQQTADLINTNAFWKDFAQHDPATPFLSKNLAVASKNFPEMMFALAALDLPFESPKHESKLDGASLTITAGGPLVVYHEEVKSAALEKDAIAKVLVSQNFFRHGDRTRIEDGEEVDKFVSEEFLVHVVYGCEIVVTNPSSNRQKLNLLLQIPRGAIPVLNSESTKTVHLQLDAFDTQTVEYHFYFPAAGQYPHFPVHVAKTEELIAFAAPLTFNVVDKPTKMDTGSWDYVSQYASTEELLNFLDKQNVDALNLSRMAWRMQDAKVFAAVIAKLTQRHIYDDTLWSYALKHNVAAAVREFLLHSPQFVTDCGGRLTSSLLTIDPVARRTYEHLEYKPLVNARTHALGRRRQIVNDRLHLQYHQTLKQLAHERTLGDDDLLTVTYYLLLQDRIEEAIKTFCRVNPDKIATKVQYDYCAAYLDFFTDDHQRARAIADKYASYPVDRWRQTFAAIRAQLDEAEGKGAAGATDEDRNRQQDQLASTEPSFEFSVEGKQIKLDYQHLKSVRVNFYEMDVELLFSRNPFAQQFQGQFSSIKPNLSLDVTLSEEDNAVSDSKRNSAVKRIDLPAALQNKNILVEIVGAGLTKTHPHYSHSLSVQVIENYGQVKVTEQGTGKPIPKAYVKVYAQMANGQVKFYKDGYTDLRGRFDFASLNTNDLDMAVKFSILILSDKHGALVREAQPPKQ